MSEFPQNQEPSLEENQIRDRVDKAYKSAMSYQDYQNLTTAQSPVGVPGGKLESHVLSKNQDAIIQIPCDPNILEHFYKAAIDRLGINLNETEMRRKIEHEEAHVKKAIELGGIEKSNISFLLIFIHPYSDSHRVTFMTATKISWKEGQLNPKKWRAIAGAPRHPSPTDEGIVRAETGIKSLRMPKKLEVKPQTLINTDFIRNI